MSGVILTGHGRFASGLYQAICQIMGEQPYFCAVDFPDGKSTDELELELQEAVASCKQAGGVVFVTDILGGSPFRCASMMSMNAANMEVVTGTNMQMLIELLMERDGLSAEELRDMAIDSGKRGITSLWHESHKQQSEAEVECDGI